jgi:hypothetical protein
MGDGHSPVSARSGLHEWRLASVDPRDQGKNMYRLHTLDLYFWTQEDVKHVTGLFKKLLEQSQLDITELQEAVGETHDEVVSPVVKNLENVAISDPAYGNGQTRNSQNQAQSQATPLPPQPHPAAVSPSPISASSQMDQPISGRSPSPPASYAPMAYNPAAPPAPEPIAHREDTPPPIDGATGTGLSAAAVHDQLYVPGAPQPPPYTGLPPSGPASNMYGHHSSPQQQQQQQPLSHPSIASSNLSYGTPPTSATSSQENRRISIAEQTYVPHPTDSLSPVQTPGTQFYNQVGQSHQPLTHVQPQYADYLAARPQLPIGGFSQYQYDASQPQQTQPSNAYDVHNQLYRPTEEEHRRSSHKSSGSGGKQSRFDQGVGKFFKKLEKKIG